MPPDAEIERLLLESIEPVIERQHTWINFCLNRTIADSLDHSVLDILDFEIKLHLLSSLKDEFRDLIYANPRLTIK